ncbi:MAG: hypothetical protein COB24_06720 [Hyphomicrobiales bacterium]|nr:MAG: hypothetical protein COB24_06720 [Hyphomicrobiales bacterium]
MNKLSKMEFEFPKTIGHEDAQLKTSVIGEDMQIDGNIHSSARVIIRGTVKGDISAKNVLIEKSATHVGNIFADGVEIAGKMTGDIVAHNLAVASTASITGNIQKTVISIAFGAQIDADIKAN